jgi:kumamolisin
MPRNNPSYRPVPGSARSELAGAHRVGDLPSDDAVSVTVVLRRASDTGSSTTVTSSIEAAPADIDAIRRFADDAELTVDAVDPAARTVTLSGTAAHMNAAFQVNLGQYQDGDLTYRGRTGEVHVPVQIEPIVLAVLGLDDRPQAQTRFRVLPSAARTTGYPPAEVARRYGFPTGGDGTGQTVAVLELGGGYDLADLKTYFAAQKVRTPSITSVGVQGARNSPGQDADSEVALDIEIIGTVAPGAAQVVYFAPNTTQGFYQAIASAIHDKQHGPSVLSISWGGPESSWTPQAMDAYNELFADAAALGVAVYAAAGDDGSSDRSSDGTDQVDFPASSPNVLACGGTTLTETAETVWNQMASGHGATGGGVSRHFPLPAYQNGAKVPLNPDRKPGRGVPDVAGDADPTTGYQVRVAGRDGVVGGTSAVAPLWSGLTAIANQINGERAGAKRNLHDVLYQAPTAFTDIVSGDNGTYHAGPGWDACTGLGRPNGDQIVQVLATS